MENYANKQQRLQLIVKYLEKRAQRNGYADKAFYTSLKNFKEKFTSYI
ncbi:MAG: hypothetical protein OdinLCB4_006545 [Candidatus Odinarchaeum yellowstonii]|uniref:Uncharacterized protein n=1 Tax=Odinarchaeota yellowstonii (strain LCB_4) TaxID=1841599 RepID=A0AAF0D1U3_ODILC|nr:MAG: hypothetical protein OdinLCB4_006545 [Candidatus Odinarchaeum yellowstonii]